MNVCVLVNLESVCLCPCLCLHAITSDLLALPAEEEEEGTACVFCESCTWVLLKAAPCLWQSV